MDKLDTIVEDKLDTIVETLQLSEEILSMIALDKDTLILCSTLKGDKHQLEISRLIFSARQHQIRAISFVSKEEFENGFKGKHNFKLVKNAGENEIQQYLIDLINDAYNKKSTDIHISYMGSFTRIRLRTKGFMGRYAEFEGEIGVKLLRHMINSMTSQKSAKGFNLVEMIDARIVARKFLPSAVNSIRVHTQPIQTTSELNGGVGSFAALRLLYDSTRASGSLEERLKVLGFTTAQQGMIRELTRRGGINIVAGPTGAGKSTLLMHVMESMIKDMPQKAFFSVEDPPEYPIEGMIQCMVITNDQQESYDLAQLKMAFERVMGGTMRCDPNVIMIGEIRYKEAALFAMHVALSGHGAWASLHADDAFGIISRLEEMMRSEQMPNPLRSLCKPGLISGLIAMRLVPKLCPKCKVRYFDLPQERRNESLPQDVLMRLTEARDTETLGDICVRGQGCKDCGGDGFEGLTVAAEIVNVDREMLGYMHDGNMDKARQHWIDKLKGQTYMAQALDMIVAGEVDPYAAEICLGAPLTHLM